MAPTGMRAGGESPRMIARQTFAGSRSRHARGGGVCFSREDASCANSCSCRARQICLDMFQVARIHENHAQMIFRFNQWLLFFESVSFRLFLVVIRCFFIVLTGCFL